MTSTDPLATERFRTIVNDAIGELLWDDDAIVSSDPAAGAVMHCISEAHFERTVNESGVPVRRVAVVSEWEADPAPDPVPAALLLPDGEVDPHAEAIAVAWRHVVWGAGRIAPDLSLLAAARELGVAESFPELLPEYGTTWPA